MGPGLLPRRRASARHVEGSENSRFQRFFRVEPAGAIAGPSARAVRAAREQPATCSPNRRPGFTVRFTEPPACWCSICGRLCNPPGPESRNGLSLARNSISPPFRGHCSRPASSIPRRDQLSLLRVAAVPAASTPLRAVSNPPDRSVQPLSLPQARRPPLSLRPANRSVNPGTESIMDPNLCAGQTKKNGFLPLSTAFSRLIHQRFTSGRK